MRNKVTAKQRLTGSPPKKRVFELRPPESALGWVGLIMICLAVFLAVYGLFIDGLNELRGIIEHFYRGLSSVPQEMQ